MKKILKKYRPEEAEYYCDKHPDRVCYTELKVLSWYGSCYDTNLLTLHLCDECVKKMYGKIKKEFGIEPQENIL